MVSTHPTGNALGGRPARQNWGKFDAHKWGGFNARSQGSSEMRRLEDRIRDLERLLGRKTMEIEILREALAKSESKKPSLRLLSQPKAGSQ
jgi:transposase